MAFGTVVPKRSTVDVLLAMTRYACRRQTRALHVFLNMTIITTNSLMGACECETCIPAMVEGDTLPTYGRMATFAIRCETSDMVVILGVTTDASSLDTFVGFGLVA